jgi:hypothetical protein
MSPVGKLNALVGSLRIGIADAGGAASRQGTQEGTFTMGAGTLAVTTLTIGDFSSSGSGTAAATYPGQWLFSP